MEWIPVGISALALIAMFVAITWDYFRTRARCRKICDAIRARGPKGFDMEPGRVYEADFGAGTVREIPAPEGFFEPREL